MLYVFYRLPANKDNMTEDDINLSAYTTNRAYYKSFKELRNMDVYVTKVYDTDDAIELDSKFEIGAYNLITRDVTEFGKCRRVTILMTKYEYTVVKDIGEADILMPVFTSEDHDIYVPNLSAIKDKYIAVLEELGFYEAVLRWKANTSDIASLVEALDSYNSDLNYMDKIVNYEYDQLALFISIFYRLFKE